jgi:hypothetical protein
MVTKQTTTKRAANGARAGRKSGNAWELITRESARDRAAFIRGAMRKVKLNNAPRAARDFTHGGAVPHLIGLDDIAGKVAHRATTRAEANRITLPFAEAKEEARGAAAEIVAALCAPEGDEKVTEAARETLARFKVSPEAAPHGAAFLGAARAVDRMGRKMSHGDTLPEDYAHGAESRDDLPEAARAFALRGAYDKARALIRRAFLVHGCHVRTIQETRKGRAIGGALRKERAALRRDLRFVRRAFAYKRAVITSGAPTGRIAFTLRIASGVSPEGSGAKVRGDWSLRDKGGKGAPRRARAAWSNMLRDYRATAVRLSLPELVAADLLRA